MNVTAALTGPRRAEREHPSRRRRRRRKLGKREQFSRLHHHATEMNRRAAPQHRLLQVVLIPLGHPAGRHQNVRARLSRASNRLRQFLRVVPRDAQIRRRRAASAAAARASVDSRRRFVRRTPPARLRRPNRFVHHIARGSGSSSPVERTATRGRLRTGRMATPASAATPISWGPTRVPAGRIVSPSATSEPRGRTFAPTGTGSETRATSPATETRSTWTTASAPAGRGAPVVMYAAWPGPTAVWWARPRGRRRRRRARRAIRRADRVAVHDGRGERGCGRGATTSEESTRPIASSNPTRSSGSGDARLSATSIASRMDIIGYLCGVDIAHVSSAARNDRTTRARRVHHLGPAKERIMMMVMRAEKRKKRRAATSLVRDPTCSKVTTSSTVSSFPLPSPCLPPRLFPRLPPPPPPRRRPNL